MTFSQIFFFIFIISYFGICDACSCMDFSNEEAYCMAEWVAHTKILKRELKDSMPKNLFPEGVDIYKYSVEYGKIFKSPLEINETLPSEIFTPCWSASCGLILEAGKEYLLNGRLRNETMDIGLCGQIRHDDPIGSGFYQNVLEWKNVPNSILKKLNNSNFDENCNNTSTFF